MRKSLLGLAGLIVVVIAGLGILLSGKTPAAAPTGSYLHTTPTTNSGSGSGSSSSGSGSSGYGY
jgi:hypothetical protein